MFVKQGVKPQPAEGQLKEPVQSFKEVWAGRKKRIITGYNNWVIDLTMVVDTNTETFINELSNYNNSYDLSIGESGVIEENYSNMYVESFDSAMEVGDLQLVNINAKYCLLIE